MPLELASELRLIVEPKRQLWLEVLLRVGVVHKEGEKIVREHLLLHHCVENGSEALSGELGVSETDDCLKAAIVKDSS